MPYLPWWTSIMQKWCALEKGPWSYACVKKLFSFFLSMCRKGNLKYPIPIGKFQCTCIMALCVMLSMHALLTRKFKFWSKSYKIDKCTHQDTLLCSKESLHSIFWHHNKCRCMWLQFLTIQLQQPSDQVPMYLALHYMCI